MIEATGLFKWYLGLKVVFHKPSNPGVFTDPPVYFQTDPIAFYHYADSVWEIVKGQLVNQIENYETNGSGWIVSPFISLNISFAEMESPLQKQTRNREVKSSINVNEDDE